MIKDFLKTAEIIIGFFILGIMLSWFVFFVLSYLEDFLWLGFFVVFLLAGYIVKKNWKNSYAGIYATCSIIIPGVLASFLFAAFSGTIGSILGTLSPFAYLLGLIWEEKKIN